MNILITGGAGFIGINLLKKIHKKHKIYIFDLKNKIIKEKKILKKYNCISISGDIRVKKTFHRIKSRIDTVYHFAALCSTEMAEKYPKNCLETNVVGTKNLIDWCKKKYVKKIIFTSSMAVYGKVSKNIKENAKTKPISTYGKSKLLGERILANNKNKIKVVIFRLFNVYGPGQDFSNQKQGMLSIYLSKILKCKKVFIKGSLNRFRDFVYIDDVISALKINVESGIYNIGLGKPYKVIDLIKLLFKYTQIKFNKKNIIRLQKHRGDTWGSYSNIQKMKKNGWFPKTSLNAGIKKTIVYAKQQSFFLKK